MRIQRWIETLFLVAVAFWLMGAKSKAPRDRSLSKATAESVEKAAVLAERSTEEWDAVEARWIDGSATVQDIRELRVRWAAESNPLYEWGGWSLDLIEAGVDARVAITVPKAVRTGDMEALQEAVENYPDGASPPELRILQSAALWGMEREGMGAIVYRTVLKDDPVLAYYDDLMEEWVRDRLAELPEGEQPSFREPGDDYVSALRRELGSRDTLGQLVLWFLEPPPSVSRPSVPVVEMEPQLVSELMDSRKVDLHVCAVREGGTEILGDGSVTLDLDVDPYGTVRHCQARSSDDFGYDEVGDCACDVARSVRFPTPADGSRAATRHRVDFPIRR